MARIPTTELVSYLLAGRLYSQGCLRVRPSVVRSAVPRRTGGSSLAAPIRRRYHVTPKLASSTFTDASSEPTSNPGPAAATTEAPVPLRKLLREQAKAAKVAAKAGNNKKKANADNQTVPGWELTVGIEIHAQLNTTRKLFSAAPNGPVAATGVEDGAESDSITATPTLPNSLVAPFDLAIPGTQPVFQPGTLIPAVRAALALNCDVQRESRFDRKHYFHWDQPSGYQITQFYSPLAKDGYVDLRPRDGIAPQDAATAVDGAVRIRVKQVQMEQDTAKTLERPGDVHWLDFNRAGAPLIEIISQPDIHHPATAAAFVRKVQMLLEATDSCVVGMENGGLRADVNVSVRRVADGELAEAKLGQRTEIKNLSSFKAVEDAIIVERDRQIAVLEAGGVVEGETRGWSIGGTETRRLRGKEGEVDYRYMPDPDLGPVLIADEVVHHLRDTMGILPDQELDELVADYGLSEKDAMSLKLLDGGGRLEFYYRVVDALEARVQQALPSKTGDSSASSLEPRILAANWILHVLGSLTSEANARDSAITGDTPRGLEITPEGGAFIHPDDLAEILFFLHTRRIRLAAAKDILFAVFNETIPAEYLRKDGEEGGKPEGGASIEAYITDNNLWFSELSAEEYRSLAAEVVDAEEDALRKFLAASLKKPVKKGKGDQDGSYPQGKLMFLVGKMMRTGGGVSERLDPVQVQRVMREVVEERLDAMRAALPTEG